MPQRNGKRKQRERVLKPEGQIHALKYGLALI